MNIVAKDTPPSVPEHNADVIFAWCYSVMYDHTSMIACFHIAKTINEFIKGEITPEIENLILHLMQKVINI